MFKFLISTTNLVFLVAEIGVNWDGNIELASNMMQQAKKLGFNAVKFQSFDESIVGQHPEKNRLLKSSITRDNIELINDTAKSVGIEWFSTPMIPEAVDLLDPYVSRFKIRVSDGKPLLQNNTSVLLEKVFETKKEVIVSSETTPKNTKFATHPAIKWLYCIPIYPCKLNEVNFSTFSDFNGYSNHCPDIVAPLTAVILNAEIIEVHVTSDKTDNFVDNPVSFDFKELDSLIKLINSFEKIKTH